MLTPAQERRLEELEIRVFSSKNATPEERLEFFILTLRAGGFRQARGKLCRPVPPKAEGEPVVFGFCCLGVGTDIYSRATGIGKWVLMDPWDSALTFVTDGSFGEARTENDGLPPEQVLAWFGIYHTSNPTLLSAKSTDNDTTGTTASFWNDAAGKSFDEIADALEEEYLMPALKRQALRLAEEKRRETFDHHLDTSYLRDEQL